MAKGEQVIQITAPHFCAGVILANGRITDTAPILHYMKWWDCAAVVAYCQRKGWRWEVRDLPLK